MGGVESGAWSSAEIIRCVARLPFDIAAEAGLLRGWNRFAREQSVNRVAQVLAGYGYGVAGTALIELTSVYEALVLIEQIEIRSAGRTIGSCDALGGIVKIREYITGGPGFLGHLHGAIRGIILDVVGIYSYDCDGARLVISGELGQAGTKVLHIRAVIAHENHYEPPGVPKIGKGNFFTGWIR